MRAQLFGVARQRRAIAVIFYTLNIFPLLERLFLPQLAFVEAIAPTIDYSHNMRVLKLPQSTPVGSLIYRLKGSDGDANSQLVFGVSGIEARALLDVIPVSRSWNEADVYLRAPLERQQYNLSLYVTDGNKTTQVESTILATQDEPEEQLHSLSNQSSFNSSLTNGLSKSSLVRSPFVNTKHVLHVPENTKPDEPIGSVTVLESETSELPVRFELRGKGADKFSIKYVFGPRGQSRGELLLAAPLDFERQNLFHLKVLALNAWTDQRFDTRNVASSDLIITVGDSQDSPPIFKNLPQSLKLYNTLKQGDLVLQLEAEDGDYADQRPINYALDANSPLATYFDVDKLSGQIRLAKPMSELIIHAAWQHSASWPMLSVFASETADTSSYDHLWPPMYARAELPLMLVDLINEAPQFLGGWQTSEPKTGKQLLHGYLNEPMGDGTSPAGATVRWFTNSSTPAGGAKLAAGSLEQLAKSLAGRPLVVDLGLGQNGTFELSLDGPDAALFKVEPALPIARQTTITILVAEDTENGEGTHNNSRSLFDHETRTGERKRSHFSFDIVAKDFGAPVRQTNRIGCLIELLDVNDNAPQFESDLYVFAVYENAPVGQPLGQVRARDPDSSASGRVRYTAITGQESHLFRLDQDSGQVTLEGHLDREKRASYLFLIEARDSGQGQLANFSQLMVNVLDINDNAPVFQQTHYDAVLLADGTFHQPLVVQALDADEFGTANSQVAYEIIAGNQNDQFSIDSLSGVIYPTGAGPPQSQTEKPIQLSPALLEPIKPFPAIQAGKILPHEVEETTVPSLASGSTRAGKLTNRTRNQQQQHDAQVREFASSGHSADSTADGSANNRFGWPRSIAEGQLGEAETSVAEHSTSSLASSSARPPSGSRRLARVEPPDADQLPALDLLLNLESGSDQQVAHSIEQRSLPTNTNYLQANTMKVPPITTLIVRAHDFGIPLRSSTVRVNIYNQALMSRSVSVILNGTAEQLELRREAIERAFSSMTGSRATIESIDALSESSSISVAQVKLAVPQHSLIDLTDLSALMNAIDYHPHSTSYLYDQQQGRHPTSLGGVTVTHYIDSNGRFIPPTTYSSSNITTAANGGLYSDINSFALDTNNALERRLLIYIIIVGVCILSLLVIWMVYSCSREDQVKVVEKSAGDRNIAGSYRQRSADDSTGGQRQEATATKTLAKTTDRGTAIDSPIGNNLAKTHQTARKPGHQQADFNDQHAFGGGSINSNLHLLLPPNITTLKPDHYSMYNGQIWFEPNVTAANQQVRASMNSSSRLQPTLGRGRRASSAPSGGSLESALHSAISSATGWRQQAPGDSTTPRRATGQFFPNTIGYMENLAELTTTNSSGRPQTYSRDSKLAKQYRKRRVAPMDSDVQQQQQQQFIVPNKPPRLTTTNTARKHLAGHANEAFVHDLEAGDHDERRSRRTNERAGSVSSRSSTASGSSGAISVVLDSDQELLGFDSTGTPIIATHTRNSAKPLLIDMVDPTELVGSAARGLSRKPEKSQQTKPAAVQSHPKKLATMRKQEASVNREQADSVSRGESPGDVVSVAPTGESQAQLAGQNVGAPAEVGQSTVGGATEAPKVELNQSEPSMGNGPAEESNAKGNIAAPGDAPPIGTGSGGGQKAGAISKTNQLVNSSERNRLDRADQLRKTNSQGDLMSELNERLSRKRQQSVDSSKGASNTCMQKTSASGALVGQPVRADSDHNQLEQTIGESEATRKRQIRLMSASDSANSSTMGEPLPRSLCDMKNGELLEKQSIFALTYSGLATDKLPG